MKYRHEWKIEIAPWDIPVLRQRLSAVTKLDSHAFAGGYQVRSLYFDSPADTALREKMDGVNRREKFRLRLYDGDTDSIFLEKKEKLDSLGRKTKTRVTADWVKKILEGGQAPVVPKEGGLVEEFRAKQILYGLSPKVIVEYKREPFVYGAGNVRVTIDTDIRTGFPGMGFLEKEALTVPAGERACILEVKWDEFLPDVIIGAVALPGRRAGAFSKYARCRMYG